MSLPTAATNRGVPRVASQSKSVTRCGRGAIVMDAGCDFRW